MRQTGPRRGVTALLLMALAVTLGLIVGPSARATEAPTTVAAGAAAPVLVTGVRLQSEHDADGVYTYTATVIDEKGLPVKGATLDLGGLAENPDIRLSTTDMVVTADPTAYKASVRFPEQGTWVLLVRVHEPTQFSDVFTERIDLAPVPKDPHDLSSNPAKRAVLASDPTFYDRYNPTNPVPGSLSGVDLATTGSSHGDTAAAGDTDAATHPHPFDLSVTVIVLLHSLAAVAWLLSVAILALANRFGPGTARNEAIRFVSQRYRLLAGGGMLAAMLTGTVMAKEASAGVLHPSRLLATGLGTAYLAVFALKMMLVAVSAVTTVRLGRMIAPSRTIGRRPVLASLGAAADAGPDRRVLALAELNLLTGALILGCVAVLGQLHRGLL